MARDLGRVRGGYLPPGAEKEWPANSGWRQEITEIADTERAKAYVFPRYSFVFFRSAQGQRARRLRTVAACGVECKHQTSQPAPRP